jgi:4-carboxymuconolactone decarboxylase
LAAKDKGAKARAKARGAVLGDAHPGHDIAARAFAKPLIDWADESVWGVWAREGLELRTRCIVTATTLAVLNRPQFLAVHVRGALRNGVTANELGEIFLQLGVYAGVAAANDAMRVLQTVLEEMAAEQEGR